MLYYKSTDTRRVLCPKNRKWIDPAFVENELYTEKELRRYCERLGLNFDFVCSSCFVMLEISKKKIHCFCGCRFADSDNIIEL